MGLLGRSDPVKAGYDLSAAPESALWGPDLFVPLPERGGRPAATPFALLALRTAKDMVESLHAKERLSMSEKEQRDHTLALSARVLAVASPGTLRRSLGYESAALGDALLPDSHLAQDFGTPAAVVRKFLRGAAAHSRSTLGNKITSLKRVFRYHLDNRIPLERLGDLASLRRLAEGLNEAVEARPARDTSSGPADPGAGGIVKDGSTVAGGFLKGARSLADHDGWPFEEARDRVFSTRSYSADKSAGKKTRMSPLPPAALAKMEAYAASDASPPIPRQLTAGLVVMVLTCFRGAGAQYTFMPWLQAPGSGPLQGFVPQDKTSAEPRPVPFVRLGCNPDVDTRRVLEQVELMLDGVRDLHFTLRMPNSLDLAKATAFLKEPVGSTQLLAVLRWVLQHVVGMTPSQVKAYGVSSLRKFIPTVAVARGALLSQVRELGRWSGSTAQLDGVSSATLADWVDQDARDRTPASYGAEGAVERAAFLIGQELSACRGLIAKHGLDNLPVAGGFGVSVWGDFCDPDEYAELVRSGERLAMP